jgi:hypothetical protein
MSVTPDAIRKLLDELEANPGEAEEAPGQPFSGYANFLEAHGAGTGHRRMVDEGDGPKPATLLSSGRRRVTL